MERFTKLLLIAWVAAALVIEARLLSGGWPQLPWLMAAGVLGAAVAASITPRAVSVVLLATYAVPVLVRLMTGGRPYAPREVVWLALLFGAMLPDLLRTSWRLPARWRGPLVAGALVVAVCSPIVVLRETDFMPGLLLGREQWHLVADLWPSLLASWIGFTTLTLVLGVLWFDWLCGQPPERFERDVVTPLAVSVCALIAVTIYQYFVDVTFLNESVYGARGRAGGTTYDANVSGLLAALWIGGLFVRSEALGRFRAPIGIAAACGAGLAVWATASGSALATAAVVVLFTAVDAARVFTLRLRHVVAGALLLVLVAGLVLAGGETVSPVVRLQRRFVGPNGLSVTGVATVLWSREGYGPSAVAMIQAHPWTGVGVGMFHSLASSYYTEKRMQPDNAQNWPRHQLAELGVLGSAPWLLWFVLFSVYVLRLRRREPPGTLTLRGMLIGFGLVSMFSVPGQSPAVAVTFWVFANWLRIRVGPVEPVRPLGPMAWSGVGLIVALAAVTTTVAAATTLRPPVRKLNASAPYSYGLGPADQDGFRPAAARAVSVVGAAARWMQVTVRFEPGADSSPLDLRLTVDGRSVLKGQLSSSTQLSGVIEVPPRTRRVLLEASAVRDGERASTARLDSTPRYAIKWEFAGIRPGPGSTPER